MPRRIFAEFLGTALLLAAIVGSGIMGQALSSDLGVVLIINTLSTISALGVLIWTLGSVSGGHFNPAVTGIAALRREVRLPEAGGYVAAQIVGAVLGVGLANFMFDLPVWELSANERWGAGVWVGEIVATAGLLWVIGALTRTGKGHLGPLLVPLWIGAAFLFTSSTSFANPAVTIGRAFTDTFSGIELASVAPFIVFQLVGALLGAALTEIFYPRKAQPEPLDLPEPVHDAT
ncbi:MAG: aquaporin family protein [Actinomycetia bacterium]|nr:aquaporin family protein [Actinomycetes bacterium]